MPALPLDSPVSLLHAEYVARFPGGGDQDFERFCSSHPEHADDLRSIHAAYRLAVDLLGAGDSGAKTRPSGSAGLDAVAAAAPRTSYPVIEEVGRGGMGAVYRVYDPVFDREIALKRLLPGCDPTRFERECRISARLDHPSILPVHDRGIDAEGAPWFTMRLVRGLDLAAVIEALHAGDPKWTLPRLVEVLVRVTQVLQYAHGRGVVHRDLKPANVMVGEFGEVFVLDWGLALEVTAPGEPTGTGSADEQPGPVEQVSRDGSVVGTLRYLAPEQARGERRRLGPAVDVYGLGALLGQALTGHPPFRGRSSQEVWQRLQRGEVDVPEPGPRAPAALVAVCRQAMATDPQARYADMATMGADLRAWLEGRVVRAFEAGAWAEAHRWIGRHRALAGLFAVLVVALPLIAGLTAWIAGTADDVERARSAARIARVQQLVGRGFADLHEGVAGAQLAEGAFRAAAELEPDAPLAIVGNALALAFQGDKRGALAVFDLWLETHADALAEPVAVRRFLGADMPATVVARVTDRSALDLFVAAELLRGRRDRDSVHAAALLLESAIRRAAQPVLVIHQALLDTRIWLREEGAALELVEAMAVLWPEEPSALVARATALFEFDRAQDALALCERATALRPDWGHAWARQAQALVGCREFESALLALSKAAALRPLTVADLEARSQALIALGRYAEAEATCREALSDRDAKPTTRRQLAVALYFADRKPEALAVIEEALSEWKDGGSDMTFDYEGQRAHVLGWRGLILFDLGRRAESRPDLEAAASARWPEPALWVNLALVRAGDGDIAGAVSAASRAVELEPESGENRGVLGWTLMQNGKPAEAREQFERVVRQLPDDAGSWFNLGACSAMTARPLEAREAFLRAAELAPDDPSNWPPCIDVLVRMSRYEEACAVLERFAGNGTRESPAWQERWTWATEAIELRDSIPGMNTADAALAPARQQLARQRAHLATLLYARAFALEPQRVASEARDAARCAIEAARWVPDESSQLHDQARSWLATRLADLRADPANALPELQEWMQQYSPLAGPEAEDVPEDQRIPWTAFADEVQREIAR